MDFWYAYTGESLIAGNGRVISYVETSVSTVEIIE